MLCCLAYNSKKPKKINSVVVRKPTQVKRLN